MAIFWLAQVGESLPWLDAKVWSGRTIRLARELVNRGHKVVWWTSSYSHLEKRYRSPQSQTLHPESGIELRLLHCWPKYRHNVSLARFLNQRSLSHTFRREIVNAEAPDAIVAGLPVPEMATVAVAYAVQRTIPVVIDIRDPWPDVYARVINPIVGRQVTRWLLGGQRVHISSTLHNASALVSVADNYLQWALRYANRPRGPWDDVISIGSGLQIPPPEGSGRATRWLASAPVSIVFAGSFSASADLIALVQAAAIIEQRCTRKIKLVMVGDGDRMQEIVRLAAGKNNIVFTGWLNAASLIDTMSTCYAAVAAYSERATQVMPNKIFDYLAAGLPIISSLTGGFETIIRRERVGLTYEAGNPQSLAEKIIFLVENRIERDAMSAKCREIFDRDYDQRVLYGRYATKMEYLAQEASLK